MCIASDEVREKDPFEKLSEHIQLQISTPRVIFLRYCLYAISYLIELWIAPNHHFHTSFTLTGRKMGFRKMDGKFPPKFVKIRLFWPLLDDFWGLLHKESGPPRVGVRLTRPVRPACIFVLLRSNSMF